MNTQVVVVTGGLTGIGRATALAFAKEGAQVVVSGRRDEEGQKLVSEIREAGAEAEFILRRPTAYERLTPASAKDRSFRSVSLCHDVEGLTWVEEPRLGFVRVREGSISGR